MICSLELLLRVPSNGCYLCAFQYKLLTLSFYDISAGFLRHTVQKLTRSGFVKLKMILASGNTESELASFAANPDTVNI